MAAGLLGIQMTKKNKCKLNKETASLVLQLISYKKKIVKKIATTKMKAIVAIVMEMMMILPPVKTKI